MATPTFEAHNPDINEKRLAAVYDGIRQDWYCVRSKIQTDEDYKGFSNLCVDMWAHQASFIYLLFWYVRITDPLNDVDDENTIDDYKTEFEYTEYKKLFACHGINLDNLLERFDIEAIIANSGVDTTALVDAVERTTSIVCGCPPEQNNGAETGETETNTI